MVVPCVASIIGILFFHMPWGKEPAVSLLYYYTPIRAGFLFCFVLSKVMYSSRRPVQH